MNNGQSGNNGQAGTNQHLGLKILVIVMGIMIIIGTAIVAYTIISRVLAGSKDNAVVASDTAQPREEMSRVNNWKPRPLKAFGDVSSVIPKGAVIEEMTADRRRLLLRLRLSSGEQAVHVYSLVSGERLGTIELKSE